MSDSTSSPDTLAAALRAGDRRSLARAISVVENAPASADRLLREIYPFTGHAHLVGITGPPGAGKSTLVDALARAIRATGATVGIIAVDPSSPFSGGAVLGDRVRMTGHASDEGVFVRSMATRGHLGGLSRATGDAALLLDAAGMDIVLIETVGVGQDEVEIVRTADTSVVVLVPGAGDDVQALKAGIMEIADVFAVNKADRDGADHLVQTIRSALLLGDAHQADVTPIIKTVATTGEGVAELLRMVEAGRDVAQADRQARRRVREEARLRDLVTARFQERFGRMVTADALRAIVDDLVERRANPYSLADELFVRTCGSARS